MRMLVLAFVVSTSASAQGIAPFVLPQPYSAAVETTFVMNFSPALKNGGFESGVATDWTEYESGGFTVGDTSDAVEGTTAVRIGDGGYCNVYQVILTSSVAYTVRFQAKRYSAGGRVSVQLGDGNWLSQPALTASWAEYTLSGTASGTKITFAGDTGQSLAYDKIQVFVTP